MSEYVCAALEDLVLKELSKDCKKLREEGDGCFSCRYSKGFLSECSIGEPFTWNLDEDKED